MVPKNFVPPLAEGGVRWPKQLQVYGHGQVCDDAHLLQEHLQEPAVSNNMQQCCRYVKIYLSTVRHPLSVAMCNTDDPRNCKKLEGIFAYMKTRSV